MRLLVLGLLALRAAAQPLVPPSEGLPASLPARVLEEDGYADYPPVRFTPVPVESGGRLDGRGPIDSDDAFRALFADDHGVRLPRGGRIARLAVGTASERWIYPLGTRFVHRFFLRDGRRTLFELRLLELRPDGRWSYGVYVPGPDGPRLTLFQRDVRVADVLEGRFRRFEGRSVHPQSCRNCHVLHGLNNLVTDRMVDGPDGPCGFGPGNPALKDGRASAWARAFTESHGWDPFLN